MAIEIGLNDAQIAALKEGFTIYESVNALLDNFYISTDEGTQVDSDDRERVIVETDVLYTIKLGEIHAIGEDGTAVDLFYEPESGWEFTVISEDDVNNVNEWHDGDETYYMSDQMCEDGLAGTWNNRKRVIGVKEALEENTEATDEDVAKAYEDSEPLLTEGQVYRWEYDWYGDTDLSIEEHVFQAYKQADDPMIRTQLHDILLQLGYDVETNEELVELD